VNSGIFDLTDQMTTPDGVANFVQAQTTDANKSVVGSAGIDNENDQVP
jgi:hypothetical protein